MAKFGCPLRFMALVRELHDGMQARVKTDGEFSDECGQIGLCYGTNTIQHDVFCHAHGCFSGQ